MNQKERMLRELPYKAWQDGLEEERIATEEKLAWYNQCSPAEKEKKDKILCELLGKAGGNLTIMAPFHCTYGYNIEVGDNFFAEVNLVILDAGKVKIGNNVQIGPNVGIYTAGYPLHPDSRKSGYEYGIGITIGDNVWIGASAIINPGITIGNNVVIGSGTILTKNVPDQALVAGNPGRVIRYINEEDREYYFKRRRFDEEEDM